MAQRGGDFLKTAGGHTSTATAAAAAAMAARPGLERGEGYNKEYAGFLSDMSSEERKLMPDPERVNLVAPSETPAIQSKDPMKVNVKSSSLPTPNLQQPGGSSGAFSATTPEFMPYTGMGMAYGATPQPFMPPMPGYWPYMGMDPSLAMGGKGGMPFMPGMMPFPGMMPGMIPPGMMGGVPQAVGSGGQTTSGNGSGAARKEKRERRRRKNKSSKSTEDAPESDEASATRSEELNEVRRAGQGKCKLTLDQVMSQVSEFATDQHGSRFLQTKLEESTDSAEKLKVFEAILPKTKEMSRDQFGNFVVQKLFDIGSTDQKRKLADQLQGDVMVLSNEQHGCRVIQKALQLLPRDAQTTLALELQGKVDECIQNMHGNHVIQKCIEQMPPDSVGFIIDAVSERVEFMAEHMYGCRVIQRLLEHCAPHQLQLMLAKIEACTAALSENPYGNYVVQHMLEHGRPEDKKKILQIVGENIMDFAKNKCSSNVVEKCFEIATIGEHADALKDDRARLFSAVLEQRPGDTLTPLQQLTDDCFGNYIVQRMLEHSRGDERETIKRQLLGHIGSIQNSTNGKHILSALQKEFGIAVPSAGEEQ